MTETQLPLDNTTTLGFGQHRTGEFLEQAQIPKRVKDQARIDPKKKEGKIVAVGGGDGSLSRRKAKH